MIEKTITLDDVSLVEFLGAGNKNIDELSSAFPKSRIVSRGNEIFIQGEKSDIVQITDILHALVGIRLGPDDLRALFTGCIKAASEPSAGRMHGPDWMTVDLASGGTIYLHRERGAWRILAGRYGGLEIDYTAFRGERPSQVVLRGKDLDLTLAVDQVEIDGELPREQLVAVTIPPGVLPLTLDELRRAGPLGQ